MGLVQNTLVFIRIFAWPDDSLVISFETETTFAIRIVRPEDRISDGSRSDNRTKNEWSPYLAVCPVPVNVGVIRSDLGQHIAHLAKAKLS